METELCHDRRGSRGEHESCCWRHYHGRRRRREAEEEEEEEKPEVVDERYRRL